MAVTYTMANTTGILQVSSDGVNWENLPNPSDMEYQVYDLDAGGSTGRTLDGSMQRDRVAIKEKLVMSFPPMIGSDMQKVLSLIADQFFYCRYYSLRTGNVRTAVMYVGDRTAKAYYMYTKDGSDLYTDIKFNFIEK